MSQPNPGTSAQPLVGAQQEVAELLSDLIRIDTTNTGDTATGKGERTAAEWVAGKLDEVGIDSVIHESERGRASLVARIPGADRSRPALGYALSRRSRGRPPCPGGGMADALA